jgi:hypothetical protein
MPSIEERMATLETEFKYLRGKMSEIDEHSKDNGKHIREIKDILSQASGGWKAIALISGVAATLGALFAKIGWQTIFN